MNDLKLINKIRLIIIEVLKETKNIGQLSNKTPNRIKARGDNDIVCKLKTITKQGRYLYQTKTTSNGNVHKQWIQPLAKEGSKMVTTNNPTPKNNVIVWCDCNHFKYNLEVALYKDDASRLIRSNGADPVIMNPKEKKFLCKHLYAAQKDYLGRLK